MKLRPSGLDRYPGLFLGDSQVRVEIPASRPLAIPSAVFCLHTGLLRTKSFQAYAPLKVTEFSVICALFSPRHPHGLHPFSDPFISESSPHLSQVHVLVLITRIGRCVIHLCVYGPVSWLLYSKALLRQLRDLSCSVPNTQTFAWHEIGDQ